MGAITIEGDAKFVVPNARSSLVAGIVTMTPNSMKITWTILAVSTIPMTKHQIIVATSWTNMPSLRSSVTNVDIFRGPRRTVRIVRLSLLGISATSVTFSTMTCKRTTSTVIYADSASVEAPLDRFTAKIVRPAFQSGVSISIIAGKMNIVAINVPYVSTR